LWLRLLLSPRGASLTSSPCPYMATPTSASLARMAAPSFCSCATCGQEGERAGQGDHSCPCRAPAGPGGRLATPWLHNVGRRMLLAPAASAACVLAHLRLEEGNLLRGAHDVVEVQLVLDPHGAAGVAQRAERVVVVGVRRAAAGDEQRLAVAAQRVLRACASARGGGHGEVGPGGAAAGEEVCVS